MRTLLILSVASILGCGSAEPTTASPSTGAPSTGAPSTGAPSTAATCAPAYDVAATPGTRFEDVATESVVPWPIAGVTFATTVTRVGDAVHLVGVLTNGTDAEVNVDFLTGGVMGLSTNPFQVTVAGETVSATGPEVYPGPRRAVMPPRGTVTYTMDRCPPSFPAQVHWTFSPFAGEAIQGDVTIP